MRHMAEVIRGAEMHRHLVHYCVCVHFVVGTGEIVIALRFDRFKIDGMIVDNCNS